MVRRSDRGQREQAAYWAVRLTNEPDLMTTGERDEFERFLAADPRNAEEYHANSRILEMPADLKESDRERLIAWADRHGQRRAHWRLNVWATAASLLILVIGYLGYAKPWIRDVYSTRAGETRKVKLYVGNIAYLNTRTELRRIDDDKECRYELVRGEALFDIEPNALHPCRVMIGGSEIRVLGTRFNIRRDENGHVTVTVLQGVIEVRALGQVGTTADWSRILHANEQLEYQLLGVVRETHATKGDAAIRWRDGVYPFDHESVANVVAELSRYTDAPIHVAPDLADKRIGGALDIRNVKESIWDLQDIGPIRVREHNGGFTLEYRSEPDSKKN